MAKFSVKQVGVNGIAADRDEYEEDKMIIRPDGLFYVI